MFYIWLGIMVLLALVEIFTVNLTTIWFVVSSVVALFSTLIIEEFYIQFAIFVVIGIILLVTTRPFLIKMLIKNDTQKTNIDRIIGMKGKVIEDIKKDNLGEVKVDGKIWFAYADDNIDANKIVEILEINGTKLKVKGVE